MFSTAMIGDEQNMINPYEEEFLFDGHTLEIFMKKGISVYGTPNFWIGFYLCGM